MAIEFEFASQLQCGRVNRLNERRSSVRFYQRQNTDVDYAQTQTSMDRSVASFVKLATNSTVTKNESAKLMNSGVVKKHRVL